MGMYDTIWVNCPKCGKESGFQTKGGMCVLGDYTLANSPEDAMLDANRHSPNTCGCGTIFEIDIETRSVVVVDGVS